MGNTSNRLRMLLWTAVLAAFLGPGCKAEPPRAAATDKAQPTASSAPSPKVAASAPETTPDVCQGAEVKGPLRWFHDDYQRARDCAQAMGKPLLVDAWAPWCHTCLSMKHTVLMDPGLASVADRFVWLAVDTDREQNATLVGNLKPKVWPTFFVLAPEDGSVQARYLGAASVSDLREFLHQGEKVYLDSKGGRLDPNSPLALVRAADKAYVARDLTAADKAYSQALAAAPAAWPRRPSVLVGFIRTRYDAENWAGCTQLAQQEMARTGRSASATDFAYYAVRCAAHLDDPARARAVRELAGARVAALIEDAEAPLSKDDRSDAMRILREIRAALGDDNGARILAERQRQFLDRAAAEAPTPFAAMTFNWPRAEVYVYLGVGKELIPDLKKSVTDLPNEYDPPYRLAWVYYKSGALDEALPMAKIALDRVYGPRKARVLNLLADIHAARGDKTAERDTRRAVVTTYKSLPAGHEQPAALQQAEAALAQIDNSSSP